MSVDTKTIQSNIFGDLRLMRISILHHRSVCKENLDRFNFFKWFDEGHVIELDADQIDKVFLAAKNEAYALR